MRTGFCTEYICGLQFTDSTNMFCGPNSRLATLNCRAEASSRYPGWYRSCTKTLTTTWVLYTASAYHQSPSAMAPAQHSTAQVNVLKEQQTLTVYARGRHGHTPRYYNEEERGSNFPKRCPARRSGGERPRNGVWGLTRIRSKTLH